MMNYQKIYDSLIERGKRTLIHGYRENHHIIPKCMGGSNKKENLVYLTPEEHFVAHQLLVKIYPSNRDIIYATRMMCVGNDRVKRNNKSYGWIRARVASFPGANKGRVMPEEQKEKLRVANIGKVLSEETIQKLKDSSPHRPMSAELKQRMIEIHTNKVVSEETRKKISVARKGKVGTFLGKSHSDETKAKISEINTGRKLSEETKKKIALAGIGRKNPMSEETKRKLSESKKGKPSYTRSQETLDKMSKSAKAAADKRRLLFLSQ